MYFNLYILDREKEDKDSELNVGKHFLNLIYSQFLHDCYSDLPLLFPNI
jgi:hypothetical protein